MEPGYDPIVEWKKDSVIEEGRKFPPYRVFNQLEGDRARAHLIGCLGVSDSLDGLSTGDSNWMISNALYVQTTSCPQFELKQYTDDFDLIGMLGAAEIVSEYVLFLLPFEGAYDSVVEMLTADFITFFDDIWYPSDDIVILNLALSSLLLVTHFGKVGILSLKGPGSS